MSNNELVKSRYWEAIFYPENCLDNWRSLLPDIIQVPCCYCCHDKDVIGEQYNMLETRKVHTHIILVFDGPTTAKKAKEIVNRLSKPGACCCPVVIPIISIKKCYDYLIHNTEAAINAGKYQYDKKERVCCNNFDIGLYNQIATAEKNQALNDLTNIIFVKRFANFADVYIWCVEHDNEEGLYREVLKSHSGYIDRLVRGIYHKFVDDGA